MKRLLVILAVAACVAAGKPKALTFSEDIAPIMFNNCASCHRPGEAGPFPLLSYQDVKKRGALIAAVTKSRYMPPWHAAPGYGDFIGEHRLTDEQIAAIQQWVDAGMPQGDPKKLPPLYPSSPRAGSSESRNFADKAPERMITPVQLPPAFGLGAGIDIPPGEKAFQIKDSFTLPIDVEGLQVGGHAHYLAKDMQMTATLPDGGKKWLLWIKDWDFSWQDQYQYKEPVPLPKGTRIDVTITYDNSAENPRNPSNPPKRVQWGEQSFDEMGSITLQTVPLRQSEYRVLTGALQEKRAAAIRSALMSGMGPLLRRLSAPE